MNEEPNSPVRVDLDTVDANIREALAHLTSMGPQTDPTEAINVAAVIVGSVAASVMDATKSLRGIESALVAIAKSQDGMLGVALADVNEAIAQAIEKGVDEGVKAAISKRTFIGKTPNAQAE